MIAGLWFTFGGDAAALIESVRSFRAAGGGPVCLFVEESNPLTPETLAAIAPDHHELRPSFGNLNGWDAVRYILLACQRMEERFPGLLGTLKLDADTWINSFGWIDTMSAICGWTLGAGRYALGMARWLRAGVPAILLSSIGSRFNGGNPGEDLAISCEAMMEFPAECVIRPGRPFHRKGFRAGGWQYNSAEPLIAPAEDYDVITFGARYTMDLKGDAARQLTGSTMTAFRQGLHG